MESPHLAAAERWIELGATSATNPLHRHLVAQLFEPLGLRCEYMDCDPVTHDIVLVLPTFVRPSWRREHVAAEYSSLCPPEELTPFSKTTVTSSGHVAFSVPAPGAMPAKLLPVHDRFNGGAELNAAIEKSRDAAARFIVHVFDSCCLPSASEAVSRGFAADPERTVERLWNAV